MKTVFILALCVAAALAKPAGNQRREMWGKPAAMNSDLLDLLNRALMRSDVAKEEEVEKEEVVEKRDKTSILSRVDELLDYAVGMDYWQATSANNFYTNLEDGLDCKDEMTSQNMHGRLLGGVGNLLHIAVGDSFWDHKQADTLYGDVRTALEGCAN